MREILTFMFYNIKIVIWLGLNDTKAVEFD